MRRAALVPAGLLAMMAACVPVPPPGAASRPAGSKPGTPRHLPAPAPMPPLASTARTIDGGRFPTLSAAIRAAGIAPLLAGPGPLTVFAPGEAAWARLAPGVLSDLLKPANRPSLVALLRFHLVAGRVTTVDLRRRAALGPVSLPTLAGESLTVTLTGDALTLTDATGHRAYVTNEDPATNGAVLELDGLLVPQSLGPQP